MSGAWRTRFGYVRKALALATGAYLAVLFFRMGTVKFDPDGFWTRAFQRWGYPSWLRITVGVVETVGGPLLMVPWLATWAGIALAGVMVGAGITRALDGRWVDVAWICLYLAGCLWLAWEWRGMRVPPGRGPDTG